jgi:hypothetical protein
MGDVFVTGSRGAPFDVMAGASLFWQPANTIASAAPMKTDRNALFIIQFLWFSRQEHSHRKADVPGSRYQRACQRLL